MPHWTIHDLRSTFPTRAADRLGIDITVVDRMLNHVATATTSKVARIYNMLELFEPRRQASNAWVALLEDDVINASAALDYCVSPEPLGNGLNALAINDVE